MNELRKFLQPLKPEETVTAEWNCQKLHNQLLVKRPGLINRKEVILHHDNAKPHAARLIQQMDKGKSTKKTNKSIENRWEVVC